MFEVLTEGPRAPFFWMSIEGLIMLRATTPINTLDAATTAGVSIPWAVVPGDDWTGDVDGVERLKALMARCLHADPSRRPSMDDFLAELDAIRDPSSVRDGGYGSARVATPAAASTRHRDGAGAAAATLSTSATRASSPSTPPPAIPAPLPVTPVGAGAVQLIDMGDAADAVAAQQAAADVLDRVCDAMALVADDDGKVTGAQLLRIVVDEGITGVAALAIRRKLGISAPPRGVRCLVLAVMLLR
jgi:hypothetical protein